MLLDQKYSGHNFWLQATYNVLLKIRHVLNILSRKSFQYCGMRFSIRLII